MEWRRNHLHSDRSRHVLNETHVERSTARRCPGIEHDRDPGNPRIDLLEHLDPLAAQRCLDVGEPGDVAARPRDAGGKASADRIGHVDEHDRDRGGFALQRRASRRRTTKITSGLSATSAFADVRIRPSSPVAQRISNRALPPSVHPSCWRPVLEAGHFGLRLRIAFDVGQQHADVPHPLTPARAPGAAVAARAPRHRTEARKKGYVRSGP